MSEFEFPLDDTFDEQFLDDEAFYEAPEQANETVEENDADAFLRQYGLSVEDLEIEVDYLLEDFLVRQSITMIFAKASQGKSFLALYIALHLLRTGKIERCVYMDMDNSTMALKGRNLDKVIQENPELIYIHRSSLTDSSPIQLLANIEVRAENNRYEGYLFVFDSIRDFLNGKDMNSDKDIIPLMERLKNIRDAGATIIFLHHTTKQKDASQYKGSSSFIDSIDVAYGLSKKMADVNGITYALKIEKDRIAVRNSGFVIDTIDQSLQMVDYDEANMDTEEADLVDDIFKKLSEAPSGMSQSALLKSVGKRKDDKAAVSVLQKHEGRLWTTAKQKQLNMLLYKPLTTLAKPTTPNDD